MRPRKNQLLVLKSVKIHDSVKDRDLVCQVKEENWESFKSSKSLVVRIQLSSKIFDDKGVELKNEYKNNSNVKIQVEDVSIL